MADYALVFPGQGAQYSGMGRDLCREDRAARAVYHEAGEVLGLEIAALCFGGPQAFLDLTVHTQIAVLTTELLAFQAFSRRFGKDPLVMAGHSLGEYAALYAAGAVGLRDVLSLVHSRALRRMDRRLRLLNVKDAVTLAKTVAVLNG